MMADMTMLSLSLSLLSSLWHIRDGDGAEGENTPWNWNMIISIIISISIHIMIAMVEVKVLFFEIILIMKHNLKLRIIRNENIIWILFQKQKI